MEANQKNCIYCDETIKAGAVKCRYCGEYLDQYLRAERTAYLRFSPANSGIAAVLSALLPGFGQIFHGWIWKGILFMALIVTLGLFGMFMPVFWAVAWLVYVWNIFDAYNKVDEQNNWVRHMKWK